MTPLQLILSELAAFGFLAALVAARPSRGRVLAAVGAAAAIAATGALALGLERGRILQSRAALDEALPIRGEEKGFVSSTACRACHPDQYASWHATYHRTMTQAATPETVVAPFAGVELTSRGRTYRLERRGDEHWVEMVDPDWEREVLAEGINPDDVVAPPRVERRVVMTTGSHHMQTYWVNSRFGRELVNLPFVYLFENRRWVPREDVFLRPPQAGRFTDLWNDNCLECHSTVGVPGLTPESDAFETRTAELGISCEACHGPAQDHVRANRNPLRRYRFHLTDGADPTIVQPARLDPERSSQVCGQCHGVALSDARDWLAQGHAYRAGEDLTESRFLVLPAENGDHPRIRALLASQPLALDARFWSDGQVRVSGREMTGMVESGCYERGDLSCLSCHSMHSSDPDDQIAPAASGDSACLQCHGDFAGRIEAHTRHRAGSSGSACANCHMPHTSYGLLKAIRSHTIDSPTVEASLSTGRPNACNLCHLDKSLAWAGEHLEAWYGQPAPALSGDQAEVSAAVLWLLSGDAGQRALMAWSFGWQPALEASGEGWVAPYLSHLLSDPYATVRYIAQRSLRRLPAYAFFDYDFLAPPPERLEARGRGIERWLAQPWDPRLGRGEGILIGPQGNLQVEAIARLAAQRDDRPMALGE